MVQRKIGNRYLFIKTGFANIDNVDAILKKLSVLQKEGIFQLFSIKPVVSLEQVVSAAEQATDSFERQANFSKNLSLEFLLRLIGTRQITKALEITGLKKGRNAVAIVACSSNRKSAEESVSAIAREIYFEESTGVIERNLKYNSHYLKKIYGISNTQLETLKDLREPLKEAVFERIAILSLEE